MSVLLLSLNFDLLTASHLKQCNVIMDFHCDRPSIAIMIDIDPSHCNGCASLVSAAVSIYRKSVDEMVDIPSLLAAGFSDFRKTQWRATSSTVSIQDSLSLG